MRTVAVLALIGVLMTAAAAAQEVRKTHALSLAGAPKYAADFSQLDFVNPAAPKGGTLRLAATGGFDTLNPYIIKGNPAAGLGLTVDTLMTSPMDDISAEYGLIAESLEVPEDQSWVIFNLRPEARFHDGSPITAGDVIFTFNLLSEQGRPFYRYYYRNVVAVEALGTHRVKFTFSGPGNRELPQIMGQLPVLSKAYWQNRDFEQTTLEPPLGNGPYRVKSFDTNRAITYERVADYWARDLPINRGRNNFDQVQFDYYRDATVSLEAFGAHEYDYRNENSSKAWATGYKFKAVEQGLVKVALVPHQRPTGMQGFVYNLRRPVFQNRVLRRALAYAFDFEWSNANLFYGQYTRTESYFSNSELAARGLPSPAELKLLEPLRNDLPAEVFSEIYRAPSTADGNSLRRNLRRALKLLKGAGFRLVDKKLVDPATGRPVSFEILLVAPTFERVVLPFIQNLKRLGVAARVRTVDTAQYQNRVRDFDFDMVIATYPQSLSPGNEQRDFFSSAAADRPGSRNLIGIKSAAIDTLVDHVIFAKSRPALVTATRALDRALLWGFYVIPQWHIRADRIAYWDKFGQAEKKPRYGVDIFSWWVDPAKEAALARAKTTLEQ